MTPRTFLLTDEFPPLQTGIARLMGEFARRYPKGELLVSTGQHRDSLETDGKYAAATIDRLPIPTRRLKSLAGLLFWSRRVATLARQHRPAFMWSDSIRPAAYPAKWAHERVSVRYGMLVHGGDVLVELHRIHHSSLARRTVKALFASASAIVANSQWTREQTQTVLREVGLDSQAEAVKIVPLGADPDLFRPGVDTREVKARYRLNGGPWLVTVARLEDYKGIDTALKTVARLRSAGTEVNYLVVGAGKRGAAYKKLAEELKVADQVRFVGNVPDTELPALYNAATAYVGLTRKIMGGRVEGFGIALAEASACGLPVIAGRSGGVGEAVKEGETGLIVDPEDMEEIAAAVSRLLDDQLLARRLGQAGRKAVETHYNWDRVIRDLREIEAQVV